MALSEEEIEKIAECAAQKVLEQLEMPNMLANVMEHEVLGHGTIINREKAENPDIPCRVFEFEGETFAWKPGILGLISSKKNPEQLALCKIRRPASEGLSKRFAQMKRLVGAAVKPGSSSEETWRSVGENLSQEGADV